jgi:hypothetical protein
MAKDRQGRVTGGIRAKIEALITVYRQNIADNNERVKRVFDADELMCERFNSESECLKEVIKELKKVIELKNQR